MPAGTMEKYTKVKKPRTRYTTIPEVGQAIIWVNNAYYRDPKSPKVKEQYLLYFQKNNMTPLEIYNHRYYVYTHKSNEHKKRYKMLYDLLPPEIRKQYVKYFDL